MDEPPSYTTILIIFSGHSLIYGLGIVVIILLLLVSALASASEAAFFSLSSEDLENYSVSKNKLENLILSLLKNPTTLLATTLTVKLFANVSVIAITTLLLADITTSKGFNGVLIILSIMVSLVFLGELSKAYGTQKNSELVRRACKLWKILVVITKPFSSLLVRLGNLFGGQSEGMQQTSAEELNEALELAVDSEHTTEGEKEILRGIVNFGSLRVKQLMHPRADISAATIELNFHELIDALNKSGFSRIPIFRGTIDRVEGVLYIKDLLPFLKQPKTFEWQKLLRPGFFVPEQKKVDSLLKDFQEKRVHMAIVVNEGSKTVGLITLEDIIEEIIGDINDEFDDVAVNYQKTDDK